jgi:D-beta-D-heptose 7-phosphate kinase/D-beta-D-heptose 1-phosphate adenosyltransferase
LNNSAQPDENGFQNGSGGVRLQAEVADSLLSRLRGRSVLIIGDVMLDHFVIGRVERISPEAPVPVVRFDHETFRVGGAANVAHNVAALGGDAQLIGVTGRDGEARTLREALARLNIRADGLVEDASRCTTRKLRVVTARNQQVARVDYESDVEVSGAVERQIIERIATLSDGAGAMVLSDYLKGTISRGVAAAALATSRARGIPLLVDPKVPHIDYYKGATLITPNHLEAEAVTLTRIRSEAEARDGARLFRERAGCESVMITRGEHGMWVMTPQQEAALPAEAREVADVTGAGDTVIATLALALAAGGSLLEAARLANHAAGIVVGKFGPATASVEELTARRSGL